MKKYIILFIGLFGLLTSLVSQQQVVVWHNGTMVVTEADSLTSPVDTSEQALIDTLRK